MNCPPMNYTVSHSKEGPLLNRNVKYFIESTIFTYVRPNEVIDCALMCWQLILECIPEELTDIQWVTIWRCAQKRSGLNWHEPKMNKADFNRARSRWAWINLDPKLFWSGNVRLKTGWFEIFRCLPGMSLKWGILIWIRSGLGQSELLDSVSGKDLTWFKIQFY